MGKRGKRKKKRGKRDEHRGEGRYVPVGAPLVGTLVDSRRIFIRFCHLETDAILSTNRNKWANFCYS